MKALCLVAHPDDEQLWAGSLIAARTDWDWTLVSLTGGPRADRFPGIVLGFPDEWRILHPDEYRQWRHAVQELDLTPDLVITHNRMGEYGHPHHMSVHWLAHELFPRVWDFYTDAAGSVGPQHTFERTWSIPVDPGKRDRFEATYPGVYDELMADRPDLVEAAFQAEWFTA